jgi:hypothetical protein
MSRKQQILETITHIFESPSTEARTDSDGSDSKRVKRLARMIGRLLRGSEGRTQEAVKQREASGKSGKFPKFSSK